MSIVQQSVRSMMAVPLQTNDRVIGLIYVDSPDLIREFTREDLGLLTVMANVAAIRIEHARLNEIELVERAMSKELDQAAHIQMGLLPSEPPKIAGMDIFGSTAPCRTVGGDYYDYLEFPDGRIGMLVGDVAGKGMPASLLMSSLQARVKVLFEDGDRLAEKITRLNKATTAHTPGQPLHHVLHDRRGPGHRRAGVHQRRAQSAGAGARQRRIRVARRRRHDSGYSAHGGIQRGARQDGARRHTGAVQ